MTQLILVPALGCNGDLYAPILPVLPKALKPMVHIPDADRYSGMVKNLLALADARFLIMGTSMGARLALEVTLVAPERVLGAVIIGAAAGAVADPAAGLRRSRRMRGGEYEIVISEMSKMIAHEAGPRGPQARVSFERMAKEVGPGITARQSDALAYREDRWDASKSITTPVLCLWGEDDQFSPAEDGRRLAQTVQRGTFVELPVCGHFPAVEYPKETADVICTWYDANFT